MNLVLQSWQLLFAILVGWVSRRQQEIIDFQNAQIEALLKTHGRRRILLTNDQRRLLAVKGKSIGRQALLQLTTIVTPDTILRWHRKLVAKKWDHSERDGSPWAAREFDWKSSISSCESPGRTRSGVTTVFKVRWSTEKVIGF